MSDFENPYQSPETQIVPETKQNSGIELTVTMLQYLNDASPWLRFIGILGYIGAACMVLGGILVPLFIILAGSYIDEQLPGMFGLVYLLYIPFGVLAFFPAHFTFMFGQKIRNYKFTNSIEDLEQALKNNKSLWKFQGILYIVALSTIPVMIIVAIIVGVVGALGVLSF